MPTNTLPPNQPLAIRGLNDVNNLIGNVVNGIPSPIKTAASDLQGAANDVRSGLSTAENDVGDWLKSGFTGGGNGSSPAPTQYKTVTTPAVPATLSYQAALGKAIQPTINALGGTTNLSQLNRALAGLPNAAAANTAIPNLSTTIASSLQGQIADYKTGLNDMLSQAGTATPLQDILKGMGELLSYPTGGQLTGNQGAPGGVAQNDTLAAVYAALQTLRNGGTLSSNTDSGAGYGQNPLATATSG